MSIPTLFPKRLDVYVITAGTFQYMTLTKPGCDHDHAIYKLDGVVTELTDVDLAAIAGAKMDPQFDTEKGEDE